MPALGRRSMPLKHSKHPLLTLLCIGFVLALVMLPVTLAQAAGPAFPGTIGFVPTTSA